MIRMFTALIGATMLATPLLGQGAMAGTKSIQLSKVVLDTDTAETIARVKGGTLCVFPSNVKIPKEKKTQDYERFDNLFTAALKDVGLTVVSTSNDMFASEDDKNKADILIGVTLRPTALNLCSSVKGEKGNVSMTAIWQIYDRASGHVVETISTSGQGVVEKFASDGMQQMINESFKVNLAALMEKGVLQKYTQASAQNNPGN